jgi:hypothetical protein
MNELYTGMDFGGSNHDLIEILSNPAKIRTQNPRNTGHKRYRYTGLLSGREIFAVCCENRTKHKCSAWTNACILKQVVHTVVTALYGLKQFT